MSNCRLEDYERLVGAIRESHGQGRTERALVIATGMRITRVREITAWLIEHDLLKGAVLGTRTDPHDSSRRIQIVNYTLTMPIAPEYLAQRIREYDSARKHGWSRVYDASGLLAVWA